MATKPESTEPHGQIQARDGDMAEQVKEPATKTGNQFNPQDRETERKGDREMIWGESGKLAY